MSGFNIGNLVHRTNRLPGFLGIIVGWTTEEADFEDGWVSCARVYWTSRGNTTTVELHNLELAQNA